MISYRRHMRRALLLIVVLVVLLSVGFTIAGNLSFRESFGESKPSNCLDANGHPISNEDGVFHLRCIDRHAQLAESGDATAIKNLADTVIEFSQVGAVPNAFLESFKERIVKSELRFRAGSKKGIEEQDIVHALNNLEDKLGAPPYARAYADEVGFLRQDLSISIPHLIKKKGAEISPIESMCLLDLLIYQKIYNEGFLRTPEERKRPESKVLVPEKNTGSPIVVVIHPRVKEMINFANRATRRSPTELLELANQLMDDLSMDK